MCVHFSRLSSHSGSWTHIPYLTYTLHGVCMLEYDFLYPTPFVAHGRMYTTPRKTRDIPTFYYTNRFKIAF